MRDSVEYYSGFSAYVGWEMLYVRESNEWLSRRRVAEGKKKKNEEAS